MSDEVAEKWLSPRALTREHLYLELADIAGAMRGRLNRLAAGAEPDWDHTRICIQHAEEVLADPNNCSLVESIVRFGRKADLSVHLVFDRPLTLFDFGSSAHFGSSALRAMAWSSPNLTAADRDGRTLEDIRRANG